MTQASGATLYAGAADIPEIASPTAPQAVGDDDNVFGLEIIDSPGHTPGHISILDAAAGILVTGDALNGTGGGVGPPDPGFSEDMTVAMESVLKLGGFRLRGRIVRPWRTHAGGSLLRSRRPGCELSRAARPPRLRSADG